MPNTAVTATPYPAYTALPDVPADLLAAITNLEKFAIPRFASAGARDTAIPAPVNGMVCYVTGTGYQKYESGWTALIPTIPTVPEMASGTASVSFSAASDSTASVNFPAGRFSTAPAVTAAVFSGAGAVNGATIRLNGVTSTGFTILLRLAASTTTTVQVMWIALNAP